MASKKVLPLHDEAEQLTRIMAAPHKTMAANNRKTQITNRQ